jgi:glycogen(starch) synthase
MYPPHHLGGYELVCRDVVESWRASGNEVSVLTTDIRLPGVADPPDESGVHRDLDFYYRDHLISRPPPRERYSIERRNHAALDRALETSRPDVVSLWHMGAMSLGLVTKLAERGIPMVFVLGDAWLTYAPLVDAWTSAFAQRPSLGRWIERLTRIPTTVPETIAHGVSCFASRWLLEQAAQRSVLKTRFSTVVPHGIDTAEFTPAADRPWRWRLASVGRLDERKGTHVAVRALAHLPPEATLHVWGRGDEHYRTRLTDLAATIGVADRVRFGELTRQALRDEYVAADAVLFPALWDEPFGLVPLEAMACGTPVVTTATGGSAEFLFDGSNCLVVPPDDDRALAGAVRRLAGDPVLRRDIVSGGLGTAEVLSVDRMASALARWHVAAARLFSEGIPDDVPGATDELRLRGIVRDD